ncbi:MAG: flavin reductase family protein [Anaerolineae bacterium]|jgi:flavin reductase (DIM6/NTAB) family NADH-FMN oxidoreductase RutF
MKLVKPGSTALYPVPAVLVSCGGETPNIITLAWVGTVSSDPPSVGIGVRPERFSHKLIADMGEFVVNLPRADQVGIVDYCGQVSGRDVDKWAVCGLTQAPAHKIRTPLVAECPVSLECRVSHQLTIGVHDLFIGQVVAVQVDESAADAQGKLDYEKAQLLSYAGGYYFRLGERLGRHGDWRRGIG